jgi:hypothetical protein
MIMESAPHTRPINTGSHVVLTVLSNLVDSARRNGLEYISVQDLEHSVSLLKRPS